MRFRWRFIQLFLTANLVFALIILSLRYSTLKNRTEKYLIDLSKDFRKNINSNVHTGSETTQRPSCRYSTVNVSTYDFDQNLYPNFHCIPLKTLDGYIPICVHDKMSMQITRNSKMRVQEKPFLSEDFEKVLMNNEEYDVVDIGANIGQFSLLAANLKRLVFAVEPMHIYVKIFHQTVILNRIETQITLVAGRPLYDQYKKIQFVAIDNGNISWTQYFNSGSKPEKRDYIMDTEVLETIQLDDLLSLVPFDKAIMIINTDGKEANVMRGGHRFFDCLDIAYVFMKWSSKMIENEKRFILNFFSRRDYTAHASGSDHMELPLDSFLIWPPNIVWKKKSQ